MNSRAVRHQVELVQYGAAQAQFNVAHAVKFLVPFMPLAEQRNIAAYLDREAARFDTLVMRTSIKTAIDIPPRMLEAALISAAATGKIDVRDESSMSPKISERAFEDVIEGALLRHGPDQYPGGRYRGAAGNADL